MRIAATLCGLAVGVALGSPAHAEDVGVIVTGDGAIQPQLEAQIEDWLSRHGHLLVPSPLPPDGVTALIDCFVVQDQACARGIVDKRARSTSVVYARVDTTQASHGGRDVTLTAYWFDKGQDVIAERKTCERCTDQSLRTIADEIMRRLVGSGNGAVKLKSTPAGARITIDGQVIGVTPLDWDLPAGKHMVQMDLPGLATASREVVVVGNRTEVVAMQLAPAEAPERASAWTRVVPLAMVIGGGVALAAGGTMIAIDQDPSPELGREIRNSGPTGLGLAIGGAVVGGAGAYLLWLRPRASSTAVAAFSGDAAYVGWLGRF